MGLPVKSNNYTKKLLIVLIVVTVLLIILGTVWYLTGDYNETRNEPEVTEDVTHTTPEPQPEPVDVVPYIATKDELLAEVNKRRAEVGVAALRHSAALEASAQQKCDDIVGRDYYDHEDPDGRQGTAIAMDKLGAHGIYSENLTIMASKSHNSAENIFTHWFTSQAHKDAALDSRATLTGFGVCHDTPNETTKDIYYIVEHFYLPQ